MDEREVAEELLASVRRAIKASEGLMESGSEDIRIFALDTFTKLGEMVMALMEVLGEAEQRDESNPLVRRARLDR